MSIERFVAILTPVFAALSGLVVSAVAQLAPGVTLNKTDVTALFVTGATAATAAALKWLHGRAQFVNAEKSAVAVEAKVRGEIAASPQAALAIGDVENLLKSHTAQIEAAIDTHVPAAVGESLKLLFAQLGAASVRPPAPAAV